MKLNLYILFLLFGFFRCELKHEEKKNTKSTEDSLKIYLNLANADDLLFKKKQDFNKKALTILMNQSNDSLNRVNLFKVANRYYNMNDWQAYGETVRVILDKSLIVQDTANSAKAYSYLGEYYGSQSISDSAFMCYFKAERMFLSLDDTYNLARTRLNKANLQYAENDFLGSEVTVFNALRVIKGKEASDLVYESNNLLGILNNELGEYNKALEYHNKALKSIDDKVIPLWNQSKATSLNNMGIVYQNMGMYKKAIDYFKRGLEQPNLINDKVAVYTMLLDNLAYSRFKIDESIDVPELFYKSLKIRDSLNYMTGIIANKIHLSEYYAFKGDTLKALQFSNEALKTARISKNDRNALTPLKQLAILEPKTGASYTKEYIRINDSLQKAERKMLDKFTRIEYETDEIKDENTSLEVQNRNLVYFFSGLAMLGLLLFVIKSQKAKNRELLFKQEQQKVNEEIYNLMISQQNTIETNRVTENKRVAQELHDGVLGRMFGIRMNLDSLNKMHDGTTIEKRTNYLTELKNIEQDIREISHDLNREKSELINNFVAIVDNLLEEQKKTFNPKLFASIDRTIKWELLSNSVKINLYRIIQESLQNINKYADAKTIKIELKKNDEDLLLMISDDGNGFDINKSKKGIGLQNIQSRTIECNGTVDIKSKKGDGTVIAISVPLEIKQILT